MKSNIFNKIDNKVKYKKIGAILTETMALFRTEQGKDHHTSCSFFAENRSASGT